MNWTLHPITRRRLQRFREHRRAWWSLWILMGLYAISLGAELLCNSRPYFVRLDGRSFFPLLFDYSQDDLLGNGIATRPDYRAIREQRPDGVMYFPPFPNGPLDIAKPDRIRIPQRVEVVLRPQPAVFSFDVRPDGSTVRPLDDPAWAELPGAATNAFRNALLARFENRTAPEAQATVTLADGRAVELSLAPFSPRAAPPRSVRVTARESSAAQAPQRVVFSPELEDGVDAWMALPPEVREDLAERVKRRFEQYVEPVTVRLEAGDVRVSFEKEDVRFPFRPVVGHPLGLDGAGRDVLARILYGFRTSIHFGLLLVAAAMTIGTVIGGLQGYFGGWTDLAGQRFTEIWENLPFLYVIMLLGSVFGRSLTLLLICYGLFNWIGISYYMRAEFLKLRRQPFVEGAMCLGLPTRAVMFRHILPNALVPIITFAPFSLIGAVSSLAALDFLGFGLPPPTPSWGELLAQAQEFKWAWWLVVYPGLALMIVILLCVFIGEGVRAAFDPRRFSRLE